MSRLFTTQDWLHQYGPMPPRSFAPGERVDWRTMFGQWMHGVIVEERGDTLIVNRINPADAYGLELKKEDVI